jgi:crotonobetainyl-CoA:carnitine CoA-transferase CaiB-like acyl-CoA transferase
VTAPETLHEEPHFKERRFFQELSRDIVGTQLYPTWPLRFSETPFRMQPAPKLGEHNEYVLETILGLSRVEIEDLEKRQIIGTQPLGLGGISA